MIEGYIGLGKKKAEKEKGHLRSPFVFTFALINYWVRDVCEIAIRSGCSTCCRGWDEKHI